MTPINVSFGEIAMWQAMGPPLVDALREKIANARKGKPADEPVTLHFVQGVAVKAMPAETVAAVLAAFAEAQK